MRRISLPRHAKQGEKNPGNRLDIGSAGESQEEQAEPPKRPRTKSTPAASKRVSFPSAPMPAKRATVRISDTPASASATPARPRRKSAPGDAASGSLTGKGKAAAERSGSRKSSDASRRSTRSERSKRDIGGSGSYDDANEGGDDSELEGDLDEVRAKGTSRAAAARKIADTWARKKQTAQLSLAAEKDALGPLIGQNDRNVFTLADWPWPQLSPSPTESEDWEQWDETGPGVPWPKPSEWRQQR